MRFLKISHVFIPSFLWLLIVLSVKGSLMEYRPHGWEPRTTLQLAQVIFRHGERNPLESLGPLYNNEDAKNFDRGWGQLTQKGELQTFALGQYLRQRYGGVIDPVFSPDQLSAVSSGLDRTIMSVLSALRGLYPNVGVNGNANCSQNSQIVPVRTIDPPVDNILHYTMPCPKFKATNDKFWPKSPKIIKLQADSAPLLAAMNKATGRSAKNWSDGFYVIDYIKVLGDQNKTLPTWVTKEMLELFEKYRTERTLLYLGSQELKRFRSPIIEKLMKTMGTHKKGKNTKKVYLYSAHDLTLLTVMIVMGFEMHSFPTYASTILLELHLNDTFQDYHVEMYFRNETMAGELEWKEPIKLEIPHCPSPCFLHRLEMVLAPLYIQNYEKECQLLKDVKTPSGGSTVHPSGILLVIFGMLGMKKIQNIF